jgi:predicted nucleotidyltransferase
MFGEKEFRYEAGAAELLAKARQSPRPARQCTLKFVGWQMKDEDQLISEIVGRIVETAQPEKIILFGSRARGDARPGSDFDVLVIQESSEPSYRRDAPLYVALADLPVEVDVLVYTPEEVAEWSQVPQAFVTTAAREGKTVYERKS